MSDFKPFERVTKTQDHEGIGKSDKSQPTFFKFTLFIFMFLSVPYLTVDTLAQYIHMKSWS